MTKKTKVLNVRLPSEIITFLDGLASNSTYSSRSEAIRDFTRQYVRGEKDAR